MNIDTGMIRMIPDGETPSPREMLIDAFTMTSKQREEMRVSKHDNRSPLGKEFKIQRDILRKQNRSAKRKAKKGNGVRKS